MSLWRTISGSSKRRVPPLQDADYDHEITLVDAPEPVRPLFAPSLGGGESPAERAASQSRAGSADPHSGRQPSMRKELAKKKYSEYQERAVDAEDDDSTPSDAGHDGLLEVRRTTTSRSRTSDAQRESTIDILYENQRGGFFCGVPLFSGRALGNLDASPWTNVNMKTSPTDITNKQVPDPSWEWVWEDWHINRDANVDEEGWQYSFAFADTFSWHDAAWWNSFVRRRAWTRRRAKKSLATISRESGVLDHHYFVVEPARSRSASGGGPGPASSDAGGGDGALGDIEIHSIDELMKALKTSRIDREKTEAVENFMQHDDEQLFFLHERMHDIMRQFIFQASRQHLLALIAHALDEEEHAAPSEETTDACQFRRRHNLSAALKAADTEVKKLEFWSDIKKLAEEGETQGAADPSQGWPGHWGGLDKSGPSGDVPPADVKPIRIELDIPAVAAQHGYDRVAITTGVQHLRQQKQKQKQKQVARANDDGVD